MSDPNDVKITERTGKVVAYSLRHLPEKTKQYKNGEGKVVGSSTLKGKVGGAIGIMVGGHLYTVPSKTSEVLLEDNESPTSTLAVQTINAMVEKYPFGKEVTFREKVIPRAGSRALHLCELVDESK